jgi:hypothetical protein
MDFLNFNKTYIDDLKFNDNIIKEYTQQSEIEIMNGKIYASGDIHGDYYLFMNILIDLSKMILIEDEYKYNEFLKTNTPEGIEKYLNSIKNEPKDIGLKWKKKNKYIVFCGDLIDNKRGDFDIKEKYGNNYIAFSEIKILYIIYYLNFISEKKSNAIFKVCGNHDFGNLTRHNKERDWIEIYSYVYKDEYIYNKSRIDYFQYDLNLITSRLLFHMIFPIIKINEHYFMHGGLSYKYFKSGKIDVVKINNDFIECVTNKKPTCELFENSNGLLWDRTFSSHNFCKKEIPQNYQNIFKYNNEVRIIIVGHCPFISSIYERICNKMNKETYYSIFPIRNENDKKENVILKKNIIESTFSNKNLKLTCDDKNHGISAQFWNNNRPQLIRLDVAMAQAFDKDNLFNIYDNDYINENNTKLILNKEFDIPNIGKEYYGRLPQILEISINEKISKYKVITATVHNALIRNKRGMFHNMEDEKIKENVSNLKFINRDINYKKYLKYKLKYIKLKTFIGGNNNNNL